MAKNPGLNKSNLTEEEKKRREEERKKRAELNRIEGLPQKERAEARGNTGVMIGGEPATPEDIERINRKAKGDPVVKREETTALSNAQQLGFNREQEQPPAQEERLTQADAETEEIQEAPGVLSFAGVSNLLEGRPVMINGQRFNTGLRGTEQEEAAGTAPEVLGGALPIGPAGFLGAAANAGKVTGVKETLKAPGKLKQLLEVAKKNPILSGFVGYGLYNNLKSISSDVMLREIKKLDTNLGKMGEAITTYDKKAQNGFYIGENGEIIEYTTKDALKDLNNAYEFLNEAERKIQEANIYQKFFLLTSGEDLNIQAEIDKLRGEVQEETGNIIATQLSQPETLTTAQDFFRKLETEGYNINES